MQRMNAVTHVNAVLLDSAESESSTIAPSHDFFYGAVNDSGIANGKAGGSASASPMAADCKVGAIAEMTSTSGTQDQIRTHKHAPGRRLNTEKK